MISSFVMKLASTIFSTHTLCVLLGVLLGSAWMMNWPTFAHYAIALDRYVSMAIRQLLGM